MSNFGQKVVSSDELQMLLERIESGLEDKHVILDYFCRSRTDEWVSTKRILLGDKLNAQDIRQVNESKLLQTLSTNAECTSK